MTLLGTEGGQGGAQNGGSGEAGGNAGSSGAGSGSLSSGGVPSFRDSWAPELKDNPALNNFKNTEDLAKSYLHAQSVIGKKGVIPPGDKASDEDYARFYKELGMPDADKYEVKIPDAIAFDKDALAQIKQMAHKAGILPRQFQPLVEKFAEVEKSRTEAAQMAANQKVSQQVDGLKKEWGGGYDKNVALARMVIKESPEFQKYLNDSGLGNDVNLIKFLSGLGQKQFGEQDLKGDGSGKMGMTPQEIDKQISQLRGHPGFADRGHGQHKVLMGQFEDLMKKRHG